MVEASLILGVLAALALIILYSKSPMFIKRLLSRFPFITEILATVFFFVSITSITQSLEGVLGAFLASALWSLFFLIKKEDMTNAPIRE